ncbi:MAG: dienelactone hydrolase family protein [Polaromonas sp.]|nr:dienelactone hydrolase family protein [Polaromonas sp.]
MTNSHQQIDAGDGGRFSAYVSTPDQPNGHAVLVVQEIFGVTPHIREVADRYARDGYLAIAPDLFWRVEPGLSLSHSKEDMQRAFAVLEKFDEDLGVQDLSATLAHARAQPGINGVGLVGMCLGGKLAYLAAARLGVDASIAFYGVGIEKNLDEARDLKRPLLLFFGGKDRYAPPAVRAQIEAATAANPQVDVRVYENSDHGFYTRGSAEIIQSAHLEATMFLKKHLPRAAARA